SGSPFFISFVACFALNSSGSNRPPIHSSMFSCSSCFGLRIASRKSPKPQTPPQSSGRTSSFTFQANRVFRLGIGRHTALEHDLMLPAIAEVILVLELEAFP